MELISLNFFFVLVAIVAGYYTVGKFAPRAQWIVLLVGSIAFYGFAGGWPLLVWVVAIALATWGAGLALDHFEQAGKAARKAAKGRDAKKAVKKQFLRKKRLVLVATLIACVGVLGYFKYWNVLLAYAGLAASPTSLGILLPLGMSFYTFVALGYLIDSYNAKYEPERNFARYLLFVSYFPQIIQGPINRYDAMSPQLYETHHANAQGIRRALLLLGFGMVKKLAIADVLAGLVSTVFTTAAGPNIPGSLAVYGVVVYAVQMYADFSGGIDIVRGVSELFGIEMAPNFRQPYFSVSLADFWRRWHMSLGAWMRDYVFYPLAVTSPSRRFGKWAGRHLGKHAGRTLPACVANIIVFLLVGLWHGAELHYVAWGLYNGLIVALADLCTPLFDRLATMTRVRRESAGFKVFAIVRTFIVVCIGRFFDCFVNVEDSFYALYNVFVRHTFAPLSEVLATYNVEHPERFGLSLITILMCVLLLAVDILSERGVDVREKILGWRAPIRVAFYLVVIIVTVYAGAYDAANGGGGFLYANF